MKKNQIAERLRQRVGQIDAGVASIHPPTLSGMNPWDQVENATAFAFEGSLDLIRNLAATRELFRVDKPDEALELLRNAQSTLAEVAEHCAFTEAGLKSLSA